MKIFPVLESGRAYIPHCVAMRRKLLNAVGFVDESENIITKQDSSQGIVQPENGLIQRQFIVF